MKGQGGRRRVREAGLLVVLAEGRLLLPLPKKNCTGCKGQSEQSHFRHCCYCCLNRTSKAQLERSCKELAVGRIEELVGERIAVLEGEGCSGSMHGGVLI